MTSKREAVEDVLAFVDDFERVYSRLGTPENPVESVTLTGREVCMLGTLITGTICDALDSPDVNRLGPLMVRLERFFSGG